jgi:hypothetical protein
MITNPKVLELEGTREVEFEFTSHMEYIRMLKQFWSVDSDVGINLMVQTLDYSDLYTGVPNLNIPVDIYRKPEQKQSWHRVPYPMNERWFDNMILEIELQRGN